MCTRVLYKYTHIYVHVRYIISTLCTHTHFLKIFYELVQVFFKYKQFRNSGLYSVIHYLFSSRDYVSVNRSEIGAMLRLEVELPVQHKRGSGIQHNPLPLKHTNTQITRDAVSKHSPSCPSDYRVIRHCRVFSSEADCWPQANSTEKASCRSEVAFSGRHWAVATAGKDSAGSICNCDAASVTCTLGCACSTPFQPGRGYITHWISGRN